MQELKSVPEASPGIAGTAPTSLRVPPPPPNAAELSWFDLLRLGWRNRWALLAVPILFAGVLVSLTLLQDRTYTVSAAFKPQGAAGAPAGLAGVAAQMGIGGAISGGAESTAFYARLLESRAVLSAVVDSPFIRPGTAGDPADFRELIQIDEPDPERSRALALEALKEMMTVRTQREAGVVEVAVTTSHPDLSLELAQRLVDQLNRFNLQQRQSQASAERQFIENRLAEVQGELAAAENRLQSFLQQNRLYANSPELRFEYERLQRDVVGRQQLSLLLTQSFEQARIDEVRDVPLITIVDPPMKPTRADARGTVRNGFVGIVLGLLVAIGLVFAREYSRHIRAVRSSTP